jgi:hypothetical protein
VLEPHEIALGYHAFSACYYWRRADVFGQRCSDNDHQADPGWWVLSGLQKLGLVWQIVLPADLPPRENMLAVSERAKEYIDKNNSIASVRQATNLLSATQE